MLARGGKREANSSLPQTGRHESPVSIAAALVATERCPLKRATCSFLLRQRASTVVAVGDAGPACEHVDGPLGASFVPGFSSFSGPRADPRTTCPLSPLPSGKVLPIGDAAVALQPHGKRRQANKLHQ